MCVLDWCTEIKTTIFIRLIIVYIIVYTIFNTLCDQEVHDRVQDITYGTARWRLSQIHVHEAIAKCAQKRERICRFESFAQIQIKRRGFVFIEVKIICIAQVAEFD